MLRYCSNPISYLPIPDTGSASDDKGYQENEGVDAKMASNKDDSEEDQGADKGQESIETTITVSPMGSDP